MEPKMSMLTIADRFQRVAREGFLALFKRHGYECKRLRCVSRGAVMRVAELEKSRWCDANHVGFTIGLGVYVPGRATWVGRPDLEKPFPTLGQGSFQVGLNALIGQRYRGSLELKSDDTDPHAHDAKLIAQLTHELEQFALPFLDRFQTIEDVIAFLESLPEGDRLPSHPMWEHSLAFELAALYGLSGDDAKSLEYVRRAIRLAEEQNVPYFVEQYRDHLQRLLGSAGRSPTGGF